MFKVIHQSGGQMVDVSSDRYESEGQAIMAAFNAADVFVRDYYKTARAGKVSVTGTKGDYSRLWDIHGGHEDKVGQWLWSVVSANK